MMHEIMYMIISEMIGGMKIIMIFSILKHIEIITIDEIIHEHHIQIQNSDMKMVTS